MAYRVDDRGDIVMSKYYKAEDVISKIVNTPTRVITDDLTALVDRQHEIIDMLSELPTIEFNKEGEWYKKEIWENNDKGRVVPVEEWQSAKCSVCGRYHITPYEYYFDDFNYCPNCGAKMKG